MANRKMSSTAPESAAPTQSKRALWPGGLSRESTAEFRTTADASSATRARGALKKKTEGQPRPLTSNPPSAGPTIMPTPTTLRCEPRALPRSAPGKTASTAAMAFAWIIAEPTP